MKSKSQKQEKSWADQVGGQLTIGSGNLWFQKGDVNTSEWKFELKTTEKKYYTLHIKDLKFCVNSAYAAYKKPAFVIQFDNKNNNENIVIIPLSDYEKEIKIDKLDVLLLKKKQLKIKQADVVDKVVVLIALKRKYLIFSDIFFMEQCMS